MLLNDLQDISFMGFLQCRRPFVPLFDKQRDSVVSFIEIGLEFVSLGCQVIRDRPEREWLRLLSFTATQIAKVARPTWVELAGQLGNLGSTKDIQPKHDVQWFCEMELCETKNTRKNHNILEIIY